MEFFTHVQKVYTETGHQGDLPLALFMIKLLSIKVDFGHFRDENNFNAYMKSDKPLKLRYYLQIKFRDEITKSSEVAQEKSNEEYKYISECFMDRSGPSATGLYNFGIPPYEKRTELYEKYLKDKDFDEEIQNKISYWIKPDMVNTNLNSDIRGLIGTEVRKKYGFDHKQSSLNIIRFIMGIFKDKESVYKLLHSMRDVYILGLV